MNLSWLSLSDPNTQWVLAGTMLLGLASGVLGAFSLLRRRSLLGDTLAHAALPGVCIAFLITGSKHLGFFLTGAAIAGLAGVLCITAITRYSKIKEDTAMGLVLAIFFGAGIMLLTMIQRLPGGNQSGLDKFLFGQAAALVGSDVRLMTWIAGGLCLAVLLFFKEFRLLAFDQQFGRGLGLPMGLLDLLLNLMIVLAVMIGLQAVGVVLIAAMLITPPIAARYWTDRLSVMVMLSGIFGALSGMLGTLLSQTGPRMPTGPLIVLAATAIFLVSLLFAPRRGLLPKLVRQLRVRRQTAREGALRALYDLTEELGASAAVPAIELVRRKGLSESKLGSVMSDLSRSSLVRVIGASYQLTESGLGEAYRLVRERRLWEVYLMHEADLGGGGGDRDGDGSLYPAELKPELERLVRSHGLEPRLKPPGREGA